MILQALKYTRLKGKPREWTITGRNGEPIYFGNINLIVGKNATGKSRTLNTIREVADLLSNKINLSKISSATADYELIFKNETNEYKYLLSFEGGVVINEILTINKELKLDRGQNKLYSERDKKYHTVIFQDNSLATTKKDTWNYPFLEKLYDWGSLLKNSPFTNQFEKNNLIKDLIELNHPKALESNYLLHIFHKGKERFGKPFLNAVKRDMLSVGYPIQTINIMDSGVGYGISVEEEELDGFTHQLDMSQGMFRAMSFIIQLNYLKISKLSASLLIDDLGEGLDFDRSKALIDLIIKSVNNSSIQMFITSNDRYIMNKIPLKFWSVIERKPHETIFYNYYNSKEIFEDFKYTGLNNFDFLATDFYIKGFEGQE